MASCTQCNAELDDGAKFCIKCGTAVSTEVACPSCSTVNLAGAKFCTNCGQVLGGAVSPPVAGQSGDDVYARRVSADEIEASTFRSSLVIRPGSYGVELQNGVVTRTFKEPGKQTIEGFFSRLRDVFSSDSNKEVMVVDVREVVVSLSTNVPNHTLLVFLVAGGTRPETDAFHINLSLFVERVVKDKRQLSTIDVERIAKKYLTENFPASTIGDGTSLEVLGRMEEGLRSQFGLVATEIRLEQGIPRNSYDLTLGGNEGSEQFCEHCAATILPGVKFCTKCGTEQSASRLTALASKDGTPVVVDVSVVLEVDESGLKDEDLPLVSSLQNPVESILRRLLREHDYDALDQGQLSKVSAQLQTALSSQLDVSKFGRVTSATVLDIKTVEEDWKLGTRAAVTQAQEELEASRTMTGIERDKVDVQEMALRIGLQRTKMELDVELQEYFDRDQAALEDRARRQSMVGQHADLDVADAQRAAERDIATDEADRKRDRTVTARDREDKAGDRGEEIKDLGHEMDLETRTARHDVDLGAIAGEADSAQKRREADDAIYAEKQAQDLKLEKMGGMLDLEERIAAREEGERKAREDHELAQAEQQRKGESDKREQLAGLTTEQILAMQAGELAGKGQDISSIADSISGTDAEKEKAELQEKLLREMLDRSDASREQELARERSSREDLKDLAKDAIGGTREGESKTTQAHKTAADQAVSMSEKSMDAMAKVASSAATAASKAEKKEAGTKKSAKKVDCVNEGCDAKVDEGAGFCGECGSSQDS